MGWEVTKNNTSRYVHISGNIRKHIYVRMICTLPESSIFAGYDGTQCELGLFQGSWTAKRLPIRQKKRFFVAFCEQIGACVVRPRNS